MDLPRARERNKTLVARFWTPGVGNCLILPPQKSNAMISKTFPDKKWVKTPPKNEKTTITAKQPCILGRLVSHRFFWRGVVLMYLSTLNTKIKTKKIWKIGNNWSRAPKVEKNQKYSKMSFFLYFLSNFEIWNIFHKYSTYVCYIHDFFQNCYSTPYN